MDDLDALATAHRTDLVALIRQLRVALAEAQATIEQLEAQVAALETRVSPTTNQAERDVRHCQHPRRRVGPPIGEKKGRLR